jgi:putative membrane protein
MRWSLTAAALAAFPAFLLAMTPAAWAQAPNHGEPAASNRQHPVNPPLDDPTIVAIFDAANTADIETGDLGAKRGNDKAVREYGAMLAHDHGAVRQLGRDLAKKLGVTPTPPADRSGAEAHAQAMASLRAKHGADFDHAFLEHEVAFHQAVIDAIQTTLLPAIKNEELKALVVKVPPAFQAHMLAGQQLEKRLEKQLGSK